MPLSYAQAHLKTYSVGYGTLKVAVIYPPKPKSIQLLHLRSLTRADFPPHDQQFRVWGVTKLLLLLYKRYSCIAVHECNELLAVQLIYKCLLHRQFRSALCRPHTHHLAEAVPVKAIWGSKDVSGNSSGTFIVVDVVAASPRERMENPCELLQERGVYGFVVLPELLACHALLARCHRDQDERIFGDDCIRHVVDVVWLLSDVGEVGVYE